MPSVCEVRLGVGCGLGMGPNRAMGSGERVVSVGQALRWKAASGWEACAGVGQAGVVAAGRAEEMQRSAVGEHRDVAGRRGRVGLWSEGGRRKAAPAQLGRAGCEMRGGWRGGSEGSGADGRRWSRDGIWGRGAGKGGRRGNGESKGEGDGEGEGACDTLDSKGWFDLVIRPS